MIASKNTYLIIELPVNREMGEMDLNNFYAQYGSLITSLLTITTIVVFYLQAQDIIRMLGHIANELKGIKNKIKDLQFHNV